MKKIRQARQSASQIPLTLSLFTLEQLVLIEQALIPFEQYLASAHEPLPNMDFAMETITELKGKLAKMIASNGYGEPIGLDANEVLIIHTSLVVFSYGLPNIPESPQKARMNKDCAALCNHFAPMVAMLKLQA